MAYSSCSIALQCSYSEYHQEQHLFFDWFEPRSVNQSKNFPTPLNLKENTISFSSSKIALRKKKAVMPPRLRFRESYLLQSVMIKQSKPNDKLFLPELRKIFYCSEHKRFLILLAVKSQALCVILCKLPMVIILRKINLQS